VEYRVLVRTRSPRGGSRAMAAANQAGSNSGADDVSIALVGSRGHTGPLRLAGARRGHGAAGGGSGVETFQVQV
jgi:hypothetical protein